MQNPSTPSTGPISGRWWETPGFQARTFLSTPLPQGKPRREDCRSFVPTAAISATPSRSYATNNSREPLLVETFRLCTFEIQELIQRIGKTLWKRIVPGEIGDPGDIVSEFLDKPILYAQFIQKSDQAVIFA